MEIKSEKFIIEMTHDELWNTAFDIRRSIEYALQTHWINHQDVWEKNEKERLFRCKRMVVALGRVELYDEIFGKAKEIFTEFNKTSK